MMIDLIDRQEAIDAINALEYPSSLVDVKRVIVELPSAQFATDINVGDTISRQMTIDTVLAKLTERERKNLRHVWTTVEVKYFISKMLEQLPSAQSERTRGHYIKGKNGEWYCSECRRIDDKYSVANFCWYCGARMDGESDE